MKISRDWLQTFFEKPLPSADELAQALTFHAFEIESTEKIGTDDVLDVKVTPNRGHDCLSHRGIAKEISAIAQLPMKEDPLRSAVTLEPQSDLVEVVVEDSTRCPRFTGVCIEDLRVGPSPEWLRTRLEALGQKSINNVVDATNYVMFGIGQPLHAFDLGKLTEKNGRYRMCVRQAQKGEKLLGLDDKEYELDTSVLVIEDAHATSVASIAGIKGGKPTGIDEKTTRIFLEAANWDGVTTRKTSQTLKLRTDASDRFQQVISPQLAAYGLKMTADLIIELAGGKVVGFTDVYPNPKKMPSVQVSLEKINAVLGTQLTDTDVKDVFARLTLPCELRENVYHVHAPFERLDIVLSEDLIEEVGRIIGYDHVPATELPPFLKNVEISESFYAAEKAREELVSKGYSEVYTSVFAEKGERAVANKIGGDKPYLRATLVDGLKEALERNARITDVLGISEVRLFEVGTVWKNGAEFMMLGTADSKGVLESPLKPLDSDAYDQLPTSTTVRYQPFSKYPFIVRDVALWVPVGTKSEDVLGVIQANAGSLLVRSQLFDQFEKDGKISYAFRLVFQSFEKTLTDVEVNEYMEHVVAALSQKGWEVR